MSLVVVIRSRRLTCFYLVIFSSRVDSLFGIGCVYAADPCNIVNHFYQFDTSLRFGKSRCPLLHLIWFANVWMLWKERNEMLFRGQERSPYQILEAVELLSFGGIKLNLLLFLIVFIIGVKTLSFVRCWLIFVLLHLNCYCIFWLSSMVHLVP